jgi:hypothetical protein
MADVHAKWVQGNLIWYDTHRKRWLDAYGPNVIKWEMPRCGGAFDDTTNDPTWGTCTNKESGGAGSVAVTGGDARGKSLKIVLSAGEYDGCNLQAHGTTFALAAQKPMYFGAKVEINHATSTDLFVGMHKTLTTVLKSAAAHGLHSSAKSLVGFYKIDAGTATKYISKKTSTASSSSAATMDTSAHIYEWYYDAKSSSANIMFYVDGTNVGTVTTAGAIPTAVMRPTIAFRNGNAAARTCYVHWMRAIQLDS